jgi:hypothetical protein
VESYGFRANPILDYNPGLTIRKVENETQIKNNWEGHYRTVN